MARAVQVDVESPFVVLQLSVAVNVAPRSMPLIHFSVLLAMFLSWLDQTVVVTGILAPRCANQGAASALVSSCELTGPGTGRAASVRCARQRE